MPGPQQDADDEKPDRDGVARHDAADGCDKMPRLLEGRKGAPRAGHEQRQREQRSEARQREYAGRHTGRCSDSSPAAASPR